MKQPTRLHYAGIDWAARLHVVCVVDAAGAIRARFQVPNTGKGFPGLCRRLAKLGVAAVAIERPDGPLVEAMLNTGLKVVVVAPRQVKALRSRYRASGAKSDPADAYVLADGLRTDGHGLTPLTPDSDPTKILRALSRTRKDLQEARVALCNQLQAQLERCFPGAIGLFAELPTPIAVAFLRRYPTSHAAATLTQAKLAAFLRRLHYPGRTPTATLLGRIKTAPAAGISPAEAAGRAVCVLALLDAIQATARQERELEAEIIERLEVHTDAHVFTSLPKQIKSLSGGMRRRVALAQALLGDPDLLVLDEPTAGLDPEQRLRFRELVSRLGEGRTVLLSTHQTEDVVALCQQVLVLHLGKLRFAGTPLELAALAEGHVWQSQERDPGTLAAWRTGTGQHRNIGDPPAGADLLEPTLEDGYLLLLGGDQVEEAAA